MDKQTLKKNYEKACNDYLKIFCKRNGFDYESASWFGGKAGGIIDSNDCCVGMDTIITFIEMDAKHEDFEAWYDYTITLGMFDIHESPTFEKWLKGCPRKTDEELAELRRLHGNVEKAEKLLEEEIQRQKENGQTPQMQ